MLSIKKTIITVLFFIFIVALNPIDINAFEFNYEGSTLWSKVKDVEVVGNYAYCAYQNGLLVLNVI